MRFRQYWAAVFSSLTLLWWAVSCSVKCPFITWTVLPKSSVNDYLYIFKSVLQHQVVANKAGGRVKDDSNTLLLITIRASKSCKTTNMTTGETRSVILPGDRCALVRFWNNAYDFRTNCTPLISITIINQCINEYFKIQ